MAFFAWRLAGNYGDERSADGISPARSCMVTVGAVSPDSSQRQIVLHALGNVSIFSQERNWELRMLAPIASARTLLMKARHDGPPEKTEEEKAALIARCMMTALCRSKEYKKLPIIDCLPLGNNHQQAFSVTCQTSSCNQAPDLSDLSNKTGQLA